MGKRSGSTTISEVAQRAGVSNATVSRIMNGRFVGDPLVADRVRDVAKQLGYSPSPLARGLALGRTRTIAFVVPDLANPAFQAVLAGLSKSAGQDGYRVLVADSAESTEEETLLATECRRRCDSVVLCAPRMPDDQLVALESTLDPLVLVNRPSARTGAPSLSIDYAMGVQGLAQHLHDLGHRRLVYVAGPEGSVSNQHRVRGLEEFQRLYPDVDVARVQGGVRPEEGIAAANEVLATGATAALAFNDLVAVGLMNELVARGKRVPEDISVVGFDDIPFARFTAPPLTTASVPYEELGVQAWERLHSVIRHQSPGHNVTFQPRVEVRGSSGPAPRVD